MTRFFVSPSAVVEGYVTLEGPDAHHAATVLRLKPGAQVSVADGTGSVYACEVTTVEKRTVGLAVLDSVVMPEPPVTLTLVQALPKGDKLEWVVQKVTELGAARIVPMAAARCVMKIEPAKAESKRERWAAIAREAAEQSERATLPEVTLPVAFGPLPEFEPGRAFVLAERSNGVTLSIALRDLTPGPLTLYVGPEGGWTPEELACLHAGGVQSVSLGPRILRTETAAIAAVAIAMAAFES